MGKRITPRHPSSSRKRLVRVGVKGRQRSHYKLVEPIYVSCYFLNLTNLSFLLYVQLQINKILISVGHNDSLEPTFSHINFQSAPFLQLKIRVGCVNCLSMRVI